MCTTRRAFTMIELLITIAIIMLLATLIIVALRGVRQVGNRAESANTLRQMAIAYNTYSNDNNQNLMPGYISPDSFLPTGYFADMKVRMEGGTPLDLTTLAGREDAGSYVWRLAPYLDHNWKTFLVDYRNRELTTKLTNEIEQRDIYGPGSATAAGPQYMGIGQVPGFGMNSIFVGGDNYHGSDWMKSRNPWGPIDGLPWESSETLAATRFSEVKNPAKLMVFATAIHEDSANLFPQTQINRVDWGYCELRPPFVDLQGSKWFDRQWWFQGNAIVAFTGASYAKGGGFPFARWGDKIPLAHLDGSTSIVTAYELAYDMTIWSPFEIVRNEVDAAEIHVP